MTSLEKFMRFLAEHNYYISEDMVNYYWDLRWEDEQKEMANSQSVELPDQNIVSERV